MPHSNESATKIAKLLEVRKPAVAEATFIRSADTTAYTVGDAIFPPAPTEGEQIKSLLFKDAVPANGDSAIILNAQLFHYAAEATRLDAWLYLFSAPLATTPVDNAPFAPTTAELDTLIGSIHFAEGMATDVGSSFSLYQVIPHLIVQAASDSRDLHGVLVAGKAYVPLASEKIRVVLGTLPRDLSIY